MKGEPSDKDDSDPADIERIHRHLLGELEAEEFHRLEADLLASADLRGRYLRAVRCDVALHDVSSQSYGEENLAEIPKKVSRAIPASIAAALGLAALGVWSLISREAPPLAVTTSSPAEEVATLVDNRDCKWKDSQVLLVDHRLPPGMMTLDSGVALIEFDGGARLALQGPAVLELMGPKTARLHHGSATVRCEEGLYSFSLLTPTSTVVDLGTEFGVAVASDGTSEVHVLDGEVEVADTLNITQQNTLLLNAGETVLVSSNGSNQLVDDSTKSWVRDYTSEADRKAKAIPPRVIARDVFPENRSVPQRFALGTGWKGSWWQATSGNKGGFRFNNMEPLVKRDGKPGLAMQVPGWVEVRRFLADPIDPTVSQTLFLGFSLHRINPTQRDKSGKLSEATVMFRSSKDPTSILGMALSGRNHWVVLEQGGWERSEMPVKGDGPFFVVARIEIDPRRGNKVSMVGYDQISGVPLQEPDTWEFVTRRQLAKMNKPLDLIAIQVRQTPFKFGEIVIGNSWQAVVNPPIEQGK